jgi:hypothetical protein
MQSVALLADRAWRAGLVGSRGAQQALPAHSGGRGKGGGDQVWGRGVASGRCVGGGPGSETLLRDLRGSSGRRLQQGGHWLAAGIFGTVTNASNGAPVVKQRKCKLVGIQVLVVMQRK